MSKEFLWYNETSKPVTQEIQELYLQLSVSLQEMVLLSFAKSLRPSPNTRDQVQIPGSKV